MELSGKLYKYANNYGYQMLLGNFNGNDGEKEANKFQLLTSMFFSLWHEIAHAEFLKFGEKTAFYDQYIETVYKILDEIPEDAFVEDEPYLSEIYIQIKNRTVDNNLIEELAADLRAFQRLMEFDLISEIKNNLATIFQYIKYGTKHFIKVDFTWGGCFFDRC